MEQATLSDPAGGAVGRRVGLWLGPALFLAIAYGASVGGMTTLVGTPPNLDVSE